MNPSGRPASPARPAAPRPARTRGDERRAPGAGVRKKVRGTGKELLMAFGILGACGVIALIWWKWNEKALQENKDSAAAQEQIFKQNLQRGFDAYKRAENAGLAYVTAGETTPDDKLFGPFRSDVNVHNVIYDRNYTTERVPVMGTQKAMYPERINILKIDDFFKVDEVTGVRCCYGFTTDEKHRPLQPLVVASKVVRPKEGDTVNLPGTITIVVTADNDEKFERVRHPKAERR